jgi:hypothetical protein
MVLSEGGIYGKLGTWTGMNIKIKLTPDALADLSIIQECGVRNHGFLLGSMIGRYGIIEKILALPFSKKNGEFQFNLVCRHHGQRVVGIFFAYRPVVLQHFMVERLLLQVGPDGVTVGQVKVGPGGRLEFEELSENGDES